MLDLPGISQRASAALTASTATVASTWWAIGLVGVIGFPLYYLMWRFWLPQPYENLGLRLVGALLCSGLVFNARWPQAWKKWLPWYWHLCVFFCLPFFFSFMYFMNHGNLVWVLSALTSAFLLIMIVDWVSLLLHTFVGSLAGWLAFVLVAPNRALPPASTEFLVVLLFGIIGGAVFSYRKGIIERERSEGMMSAAGIIAHELRTPLASINLAARGVASNQEALLDGYRLAAGAGLPVQRIRRSNLTRLSDAASRIQAETARANFVIDLLLTNLRAQRFHAANDRVQAIRVTVDNALRHYPFRDDRESGRITWLDGPDFEYTGPQILVEHVVFNLLKNALHFTDQIDGAEIRIWTSKDGHGHCLHVFDTGAGIPAKDLNRIFDQFFSHLRSGEGTGLGLYFSKRIMERIGGRIECRSELGQFTEFLLFFPVSDSGASS